MGELLLFLVLVLTLNKMSIKRIKDESKLIAKYKIKAGKRYYFHVFLWDSQESFDENTVGNIKGQSAGCVNLSPWYYKISKSGTEEKRVQPKLGEVHFISGKWTTEIVAHELCHALIHRLRTINPTANDVLWQEKDSEETICYEFGGWMEQIYRLLWEDDPKKEIRK